MPMVRMDGGHTVLTDEPPLGGQLGAGLLQPLLQPFEQELHVTAPAGGPALVTSFLSFHA